ncbi:MAG: response regulator [Spirochaetaceae bacterium]
MKILVIDDSTVMRRIHMNLLKEIGFNKSDILEAENGEVALKLSLDNDIKLFLLDWNMPRLNGLDFTKNIRSLEKYKKIPIIMVTSEAAKYHVVEAIKAGVTNYVVKPIKSDVLVEKISKYVKTGKM